MDKSVLEAASDLGANNMQVFFKAVVPLSLPGIVSGITMVFMPSMTCYVVSDVLSERTFEVLGNLIERNYMDNWNFASAIAIVLLVIIGVVMLFTYRFEDHDVNAREADCGKKILCGRLRLSGPGLHVRPILFLIIFSFTDTTVLGMWNGFTFSCTARCSTTAS